MANAGGNWSNGAKAGVSYLNCNNSRTNTNTNLGFRPASTQVAKRFVTVRCCRLKGLLPEQ